jgi:hypothetical protein
MILLAYTYITRIVWFSIVEFSELALCILCIHTSITV